MAAVFGKAAMREQLIQAGALLNFIPLSFKHQEAPNLSQLYLMVDRARGLDSSGDADTSVLEQYRLPALSSDGPRERPAPGPAVVIPRALLFYR